MNFEYKKDKFWGPLSFDSQAVSTQVRIIATGTSAIYIENVYIQNYVTETLRPNIVSLFPIAMLNLDYSGADSHNLTLIDPSDEEYHIPYLDNYLVQPGNESYYKKGIASSIYNYRTKYKIVLYPDDFFSFDLTFAPSYNTSDFSTADLVVKYKLGPNTRVLENTYNITAGSILNESSIYDNELGSQVLFINGLPSNSIIDIQ